MEFLNQKKQKGYIALMSVIIISLVLLALVSVLSMSGYFSRFNVLAGEYKRVSLGLAESCVNVALLEIAQDPNYTGGGPPIDVGANQCNIKPVFYSCFTTCNTDGYDDNHQKIATISTWAQYPLINGTFSNLEVSATVQDPTYSPPSQLTVRAYVYGGTKLPSDFAPYKVSGTKVFTAVLDTPTIVPAGDYYVTQTNDSDYTTTYSADCNSSGYVNIGFNENKTCVIVNAYKSKTANLTVIADVVNPYGGPTKSPSDFKLYIDGIELQSGQSMDLSTESGLNNHKVTAGSDPDYTPGDWSLPCAPNGDITLNPGDPPQTCKVVYTKNPPPSPSCADTLMMLDRTGSMDPDGSENYLPDERTAAKALLDLYSPLSPAPKVGVGVFKDPAASDTLAPAKIVGSLTTTYNPGLYNAIDTGLASAGGYTNLSSALSVGHNELISNGSPTAANVLILISDGITNRPGCTGSSSCQAAMDAATTAANNAKGSETKIYTIHFGENASVPGGITSQDFLASLANNSAVDHFLNADTGFLSPSANTQNGSGDNWSNPSGAYANGGSAAYDNEGDRHRYYNFGFNVPSNSTINGIEVKADAWATTDTGLISPPNQSADSGGDGNGFESNPNNAFADGGGYASNINGAADRHRFYGYNFGIPSGAVINGIEVQLDWWLDSTYGNNSMSVELSWNGGTSWTSLQTNSTESTSDTNNKILGGSANTWGRTWSVSDFSTTNFRIRVTSNSNYSTRDFYLDWVPVRVYYTPVSSNCQLGVDLSWNGSSWWGSDWSNEKNVNLTGAETTYNLGGDSDKWGTHSWQASEFSNTNFRVRVHEIGSGCLAQLDWLQAKVYYATVDAAAENADGDNFYISPTSADMKGVFEDIGKAVCPAAGGPVTPPTPSPPTITVITEIFNNYGGSKQPTDVNISIPTAVDPGQSSLLGKAWPGDTVTVAEGSYAITASDLDNYTKSDDCTGTINAGSNQTCKITYNQNAPPPPPLPPPPPNIIIDIWKETP